MNIIMEEHRLAVKSLSKQVKNFYLQKKKFRIYHGTTNSTRAQNFKQGEMIDVSKLNRIISVNKKELFALVESNVPMDKLVKETLKFGLIPPVVMEFPGITVGGGIQGGAGESSSFKWGGFHNISSEYEMILGNGEVVHVSSGNMSDLYYGTACSYGSLGIITAAKVQLIPAKKYVHLTYERVENYNAAVKLIKKRTGEKVDFIDGILFSEHLGAVMTGKLSDQKNIPISRFLRAADEWFYIHAENITKRYGKYEERIPIKDYFFRYDRGGFWVGKYPFTKSKIPFNRLNRFLLNPLLHTRTLYRFLHAINITQRFFVQDFALPYENTLSFINFIVKKTNIFPLWLCPLKVSQKEKLSSNYLKTNFIINVGVWGKIQNDYASFVALNREVEKELNRLGGRKWLYAHAYYTRQEFWKLYDLQWYKKLRQKYYAPEVFPDIYEKTKVKDKYQVSVLKGLLEIIKSPFNLPVSNQK